METLIQLLLNDQKIVFFAFWGAIGALVNAILSLYAETTGQIPKSNRIFGTQRPTFYLVLFQLFASASIGATTAIVANHNVAIALLSGFFSQQLGIVLIKWSYTKNFKLAINEAIAQWITAVTKDLVKIEPKKDDKKSDEKTE